MPENMEIAIRTAEPLKSPPDPMRYDIWNDGSSIGVSEYESVVPVR